MAADLTCAERLRRLDGCQGSPDCLYQTAARPKTVQTTVHFINRRADDVQPSALSSQSQPDRDSRVIRIQTDNWYLRMRFEWLRYHHKVDVVRHKKILDKLSHRAGTLPLMDVTRLRWIEVLFGRRPLTTTAGRIRGIQKNAAAASDSKNSKGEKALL